MRLDPWAAAVWSAVTRSVAAAYGGSFFSSSLVSLMWSLRAAQKNSRFFLGCSMAVWVGFPERHGAG